ncbi:Hypothetical predicted protein [Pelobates cultripes]|uniref:Uncharacterized protein n=1 Tax=Pelobates cultripes TaxID=61616 RepID=A0AAD1VM15_PELCU|nr:Hypothetical predicted protein [Pelobates cultripes]
MEAGRRDQDGGGRGTRSRSPASFPAQPEVTSERARRAGRVTSAEAPRGAYVTSVRRNALTSQAPPSWNRANRSGEPGSREPGLESARAAWRDGGRPGGQLRSSGDGGHGGGRPEEAEDGGLWRGRLEMDEEAAMGEEDSVEELEELLEEQVPGNLPVSG